MTYDQDEMTAIGLRVDADEAITREEAEALVRSVQRLCKGPFKSERHKAEYDELRRAVGGPALTPEAAARGYSIELLDSLNRDYCGADFNDVIMAYPLNGEDHGDQTPFGGPDKRVPCPKCGQLISFRSPRFKLSD